MKKLFVITGVLFLSSCATIFNGSKARITLINDEVKKPVNLTVDGKTYPAVYLPAQVRVKRGFHPTTITATAEELTGTVKVEKKFNLTTLWNIWLGGVPGIAIDAATGAMMKPKYNQYLLPMQSRDNYVLKDDPTVSVEKASERVTRDKPGQTDLERTIIRWFFDSDPRGARIYWRVISSVPAEVKNTNELYLMTTPFEETKAFNILGLTYENSRDVQIEIKVSKSGYEDQVKRFNVRQAIDQQEISGFFEMIKKER